VNYGNSRDRTNITEYGMKYQIFLTAMEYDDFFATGEDKENYYSLLERLRTDCTGLMKYWNFLTERWQHAFN
jgi:hypothetical protein